MGLHPSTPYVQCVSVCAYKRTYTHTPTRIKNRDDKDKTPISPSVKNNSPRQATSALTD